MRPSRNLVVGVVNSLWSACIALALVPLYIKYLGVEAYGLIAIFTTAQAVMQLLDMGLSPTMNREVARASVSSDFTGARSLMRSLSVLYWCTAFLIAGAFALASPFIAKEWIHPKTFSEAELVTSLTLMGLVLAARWPLGIYQGAIMGAQRLVVSATINMAAVTAAAAGSIIILSYVSSTIEAFFAWQFIISVLYALTMRHAAWHVLQRNKKVKFQLVELRKVWKFSAGLGGVAITGSILAQLDKILLSRLLQLDQFGIYVIATTLAGGLYILITPAFNIIYPRLSKLIESGEIEAALTTFRLMTRLLCSALFPLAVFLGLYASDLLRLWTHTSTIPVSASSILSIFVIGTALNGVMYFPYALQLARGDAKLPFAINLVLLVFMLPTTIILATNFGAEGGAAAWAAMNIVYLLLGTWATDRYVARGLGIPWLLNDVCVPLLVAIISVGGISLVYRSTTIKGSLISICIGFLGCITTWLLLTYWSRLHVSSTKISFTDAPTRVSGL